MSTLLNLNPSIPGGKFKRLFVTLFLFLWANNLIYAQSPPQSQPRPDPLLQLMISQPPIDVITKVEARASFDPPVIRAGGQAIYRVTFNALKDSINWPVQISAPPQLKIQPTARGEIFAATAGLLKPITTFNHHVFATNSGSFTIPEFVVNVYDKPVIVPAATLQVLPPSAPPQPGAQRLTLDLVETNVFSGQPIRARVLMQASDSGNIQALSQVKFNGENFLVDNASARQSITMQPRNGVSVGTFVYETVLIPLDAGVQEVFAQGFTTGNQFSGPIVIQGQVTITGTPQYLLLDSDPVTLRVKPLPAAGKLPGFTGFIGTLASDPPSPATNCVRVGDIVKLTITFRSDGSLARLVPPPAPTANDWQVFPTQPVGPAANQPNTGFSFTYALSPLTNGIVETPRIPFCYFDPKRAAYVDLTIPSVPVTIVEAATAVDSQAIVQANELSAEEEKKKPALSPLAKTPGRATSSIVPPQLRPRFLFKQLLPLAVFAGLWMWDRRRRFLEQHPDLVRRHRAKRTLRRERRALRTAAVSGDAVCYAKQAVSAIRVACAPHFPAEPRALVCRDVLDLFDEAARNGRTGEVVRKVFSLVDASQFSASTAESNGLLKLAPELELVLDELEAKL